MLWNEIEVVLVLVFVYKDCKGNVVEGVDMFGLISEFLGVGVSVCGCCCLLIWLMVLLLYLKYVFNFSDEELV